MLVELVQEALELQGQEQERMVVIASSYYQGVQKCSEARVVVVVVRETRIMEKQVDLVEEDLEGLPLLVVLQHKGTLLTEHNQEDMLVEVLLVSSPHTLEEVVVVLVVPAMLVVGQEQERAMEE